MNCLGVGPQTTASGVAEKRAGFAVYTLALTAGRQGQQKDEKNRQREVALPNKSLGRGFDG
jgi:hypothetical protein